MKRKSHFWLVLVVVFGLIAIVNGLDLLVNQNKASVRASNNQKIITIYDRAIKQTVLTDKQTVFQVLQQAEIKLTRFDIVEPSMGTELSDGFNINIFRARPITVIDGERQVKILTPYRLPSDIAKAADVRLYPEDEVEFVVDNLSLAADAGVCMKIKRATVFELTYMGKTSQVRTRRATVGEFLKQRNIVVHSQDRLNLAKDTVIKPHLKLEIWREGQQERTLEEDLPFKTRRIADFDKPIGYRQIKQAGQPGKRVVTYRLDVKNGQEVSRQELQSVVLKEPVEQIEIVGAKSYGGLTQAKGVFHFVDSKGVRHRETYYDLPMSVVMRNCGAGGKYTVREDGVKVDAAGYVIIAAHLGNYPRCSVVETSLGPGKVYDTGGFTAKHPHGFDLATDWTKRDGR